ncbi:MAG TPA: GtrA family protein [Acetobacteraceae bacterium]|nr:GtrA family protein [Acetobacteraceae bacterium]
MEALLLRLATQLPAPARTFATEARLRLLAQFAKFGTVGTLGFVVDTGVVYGLRGAIGLYWAGLASYFVAATFTWIANRLWTFRGIGSGPAHRQWARFLGANTLGFALNRGTYMLLITFVAICAREPVLATAAGAIAGMFVNFNMSRVLVFR